MNKATRILLALGLILAVATPALAEFKLNGYYRLMGYASEVRSGGSLTAAGGLGSITPDDEEGDSQTMIDQRLRMMMTYSLNDNVSIVYQAEIDNQWGEATKGGNGGKVGSDATNVETKHAYLSLKSGDTKADLGMQGAADPIQGILFNDDMAGVTVSHKIGGLTLNGIYSKWEEGYRGYYDDSDLYGAYVTNKFNDNFTAGAVVYFQDRNSATPNSAIAVPDASEAFTYGLTADARFGSFGIDGFVAMQDGESEFLVGANKESIDQEALAASIKATMKLENGNVGLRAIYFSEQDEIDELDDDRTSWQGFQGEYEFANENLMQFLVDKFVCNYGKERYAIREAAAGGFGLLGLVASGNHTLPQNMYVNWGAGYFRALTDNIVDDRMFGAPTDTDDVEGKTLGWEAAVRVGKKYFEKVDVSLNLSYADYGNFYDNSAFDQKTGTDEDPDATYKAYLMVNVPF